MIKAKNREVKFRGEFGTLVDEMLIIVHEFKVIITENPDIGIVDPDKFIKMVVDDALLPREELAKKIAEQPKEMLKDVLSKILSELEGVKE